MPIRLLALAALVLAGCADDAPPADAPAAPDAPARPHLGGEAEAVDDGLDEPGFPAFRDTLRALVARRDTAALLALVAPGARLSFGDTPGGPEGFRQMWFAGAPPDGEPVWPVLTRLLAGGSASEDGAVTVPAAGAYLPDALDPFETVAVAAERVPVRASTTDTTVVATVGRTYLPVTGPPENGAWPVTLPDGRAAAVSVDHALSPVGYRAVFWDEGSGWMLRSFLSGD